MKTDLGDGAEPALRDQHWRVIKRRKVYRGRGAGPDFWGVQRLAGYTDGRPSWELATMQYFYSKADAEAYVTAHVKAVLASSQSKSQEK